MRTKTFAIFVAPSVLTMLIFIAVPMARVVYQSVVVEQTVLEQVEIESCIPGFLDQICTTETRLRPVLDANGNPQQVRKFVGLEIFRNLLDLGSVAASISSGNWGAILNIDFWKALRFTLTFTFVTLPLVLGVGLGIALLVNSIHRAVRGPVIFISLLPFIITPVIAALAVRWLFIGDGILTALLEWWLERDISIFSAAWSIELLMLGYRVWHVAPFAFVVFYAGLQTVNHDTLESAIIDGANRWQRLRYVIVPHLSPLIVFVSLIHLMDSYRVFEEIVGFSTQGYVISLQWLTYEFLVPDEAGNRAISSASATALLTIIGIAIILFPLLRRTWRDYQTVKH